MLREQIKTQAKPKVSLQTITPAKAAKLLEVNTRNRSLSAGRVADYADLMRRGEWIDGVADISVDADGVLQNGQHTLSAVVLSGVSIVATVKRGMNIAGQDVTDAGRVRSVGDQLAIDGFSNAMQVAAIAKVIMYWREHGTPPPMGAQGGAKSYDRLQTLAYAREHRDELEGHASLAKSRLTARLVTGTQAGVLQMALTDAAPDWGAVFMAQLFDEVDENSAQVRALRHKLIKMRDSNQPANQMATYAFVIKAFNAFAAGTQISKFGLRPDEPFPVIVVPEWAE